MDLKDAAIIPKGRCPAALGTSPDYVNKLEQLGVLEFDGTPTGRKYTTFRRLQAAYEWVRSQAAA